MKCIYRLPQFLAAGVCIVIAFIVFHDIQQAQNMDLFDMIQNSSTEDNSAVTFFGADPYLVLMMTGLFFAVVLAVLRRSLLDINALTAGIIAVVFFFQAYFGAKVLYGIEMAIGDKSLDAFSMDGQSLYGTVFISLIFIPVLAKILKKDTGKVFDYIAPFWLTLLAFVRTGCYVIGCCGASAWHVGGISLVLPVQLFEVVCDLIILQIIFNIECKKDKSVAKPGNSFFLMVALYGLCRFVLEFIRETTVVWLGMTFGQIYSLICIIIAICYIAKVGKSKRYV